MRDPGLVSRAECAAARLAQAWDQWRSAYGLAGRPAGPVSSYAGYSLEHPLGQPRVVFGLDAEDAEKLAAFLDSGEAGTAAVRPTPETVAAEMAGTADVGAGCDVAGICPEYSASAPRAEETLERITASAVAGDVDAGTGDGVDYPPSQTGAGTGTGEVAVWIETLPSAWNDPRIPTWNDPSEPTSS